MFLIKFTTSAEIFSFHSKFFTYLKIPHFFRLPQVLLQLQTFYRHLQFLLSVRQSVVDGLSVFYRVSCCQHSTVCFSYLFPFVLHLLSHVASRFVLPIYRLADSVLSVATHPSPYLPWHPLLIIPPQSAVKNFKCRKTL